MTSARFCTSCGAPVMDGFCTSCKKKSVTVPGWDPAPAPVAVSPAAPGGPVGPPPGSSTTVGPAIRLDPAGPAMPGPPTVAPPAGPPVGYPVAATPAGPPAGYPPAPIGLPPPPPRPQRSHGGLIALLVVVLLAAGGGVWWWTHRSSGPDGAAEHASTTVAPTLHASSAVPVRTTRVVLGTVHTDLPVTFVKVTGTPAGVVEYGNTATKPTNTSNSPGPDRPGRRSPRPIRPRNGGSSAMPGRARP